MDPRGHSTTLAPRPLHCRLLQSSLPPTGTQPTSPRAPKVAAGRNRGAARGKKMRIFPQSRPRAGAVPVRRREERVCGDAAIPHESGRSPGSPVSSLLTGCWAPPSSFPAPVGGEPLPVRHFRRAGRGETGPWLQVFSRVGRERVELGGRRPEVLSRNARNTERPRLPGRRGRRPRTFVSRGFQAFSGRIPGPRAMGRAGHRAFQSHVWDASC